MSPSEFVWVPGLVSVTSGLTFQVKVWLAVALGDTVLSVAVTLTEYAA